MFIFLLITLLFTRFYALFNIGALFYQFEGLHCGWMAKELLDGASLWSIFNNPYFPAEGGSVVTGYMASLFFFIFGDNFFSLILVPILFSILIMVIFYLFLKKYFNYSIAIVFCFLFIFSSPDFINFSLRTIGFHVESILFSVLGLFCFFEIFINEPNYKKYLEKNPRLNLLFIVFGLISGFGIYFNYEYLIMFFTVILFWFIIDKGFILKRYFYIFLSGLIIGFLPWLIYNTTHNFNGLNIHGLGLFQIIFSKNIDQIIRTFKYILTEPLLSGHLGKVFYLTILCSFIFIILLNINIFRQIFKSMFIYKPRIKWNTIKEWIIISYAFIFVFIWSVIYMPCRPSVLPNSNIGIESLFLNGLYSRLFHIYPFLFTFVALCFNKFIPLKKDKSYFLKIAISLIFAIWILSIGFSNYSNTISVSENKMPSLEIKGYSVRLSYLRNKIPVSSFLEQDIFKVCRATRYNEMLWQLFMCNADHGSLYKLLHKIAKDTQLDDFKKPYYYLLIGLNTGDLMEGYDILTLNKLIDQRIPAKYKHYSYEGIALSLMNRRRNEIMKNIDFIEKIPMEYRHYFLLELGRVIGSYPDDKIKQERLQYSIKRFPSIYGSYIRRGLVESSANEDYLKNQHKNNIQKEEFPYLYRAIARHFFRELPSKNVMPSENVIFDFLKNYAVDKNNERYLYWGIVETYFKYDAVYQEDVIKNKIETIVKCNWTNKDALYEGLGLTLGHLTFGYIKRFMGPLENSLNSNLLSSFYYGYSISLKERYGMDIGRMKELIDNNVPEGFKKRCYYAIERQDS
ncbi:MAG: glycosyltransferase family 39 protein [Candidatus Omnitrophica bacterium]|nr:glycosyltransferase family 39 protein [Candidatus Omnitrophota bacterium]